MSALIFDIDQWPHEAEDSFDCTAVKSTRFADSTLRYILSFSLFLRFMLITCTLVYF